MECHEFVSKFEEYLQPYTYSVKWTYEGQYIKAQITFNSGKRLERLFNIKVIEPSMVDASKAEAMSVVNGHR